MRVQDGVAHYTSVMRCGRVWPCPVCGAKILNERANEISQATAKWVLRGGQVYMATMTVLHDRGMPLLQVFGVVADSFRKVLAGRGWGSER